MENNSSRYCKPSREYKIYDMLCIVFLFSLFVMPQYFGVPLPFFDFTLLRVMIVAMFIMIISNDQMKDDFVSIII